MNKEDLQNIAFEIIAHAGEAFSMFFQAVEEARTGSFDKADELMAEGEKILNEAHNAQTGMLTAEAQGKDLDLGIIAIHGQDHLMTTIMYQRMAKQIIGILRDLEAR